MNELERLQEKIQYYRNIGFFKEYSNIPIEEFTQYLINEAKNSYWEKLNADSEDIDLRILSLDKKNVWFLEDYMDYGKKFTSQQEMYKFALLKLTEISSGIFNAQNIEIVDKQYCDGGGNRWQISFDYENIKRQFIFCADLEVMVLDWLNRLNDLISEKNHTFVCLRESYGPTIVFCIETNKVSYFEKQKNYIKFNDCNFWLDVAEYFFANEDYYQAIDNYKRALQYDKNQWFAYSQLALCYYYLKNKDEEISTLQKALDLLNKLTEKNAIDEWYLNSIQKQFSARS